MALSRKNKSADLARTRSEGKQQNQQQHWSDQDQRRQGLFKQQGWGSFKGWADNETQVIDKEGNRISGKKKARRNFKIKQKNMTKEEQIKTTTTKNMDVRFHVV